MFKFCLIHLISFVSRWFSILHFPHFFVMNLVYLCDLWLLFRERVYSSSTNYILCCFDVFVFLWYGWLVTRPVTPYFCHPHFGLFLPVYFCSSHFHHSLHSTTCSSVVTCSPLIFMFHSLKLLVLIRIYVQILSDSCDFLHFWMIFNPR